MSTFTYEDTVGLIDINLKGDLNLSTKGILRMLQEAANVESSKCGYGVENMSETGTTWLLIYWRVKKIKPVKYNSKITVKTWTTFSKNIYSDRSFELYSNDELVAIADSKWIFVDSVKHSIKKLTEDIISAYGQDDKKLFEEELNQKIKFSDSALNTFDYTTLKRDLDGNHHVNNITFLDIAMEGLPDELTDNNFSDVSIVFKKEILYKDNVSCFYEKQGNEHIVYLYNKEKDILHAKVIFKEQD